MNKTCSVIFRSLTVLTDPVIFQLISPLVLLSQGLSPVLQNSESNNINDNTMILMEFATF